MKKAWLEERVTSQIGPAGQGTGTVASSTGVTQIPSRAHEFACFQVSRSSCRRWPSLGQEERVAMPDGV